MKQRRKTWLVLAATVAALGVAEQAVAQGNNDAGVPDLKNATNAGNPGAEVDSTTGLPTVREQGGVSYLSGGIGLDQSGAIRAEARHWPLELMFVRANGEYLADVGVRITDRKGNDVLNTRARGPYMLVRLRPGTYTVNASVDGGRSQKRTVTIANGGHARANFSWAAQ